MKEFTYVIKDALGIHARPAGMLAKKAKSYADTTVTISANGKSVGVKQGTEVTIACEGANEEEACAGLQQFMEENL